MEQLQIWKSMQIIRDKAVAVLNRMSALAGQWKHTSGHKPASTTVEFEKYSMLSEDAVNKYAKAEDMVENIIEDFRSTRDLTIRAIRLAQDEGDDALEDTLIAFKNDLDKNIWMLQAFIGKEALEDDDALDEDED